jgi:uncharacterized protein (DUF983 family)
MFKNPLYRFLYLTLAKVILIFSIFLLGSFIWTQPIWGAIIIALFVYLTGAVITIETIKSIYQFFNSKNKSNNEKNV